MSLGSGVIDHVGTCLPQVYVTQDITVSNIHVVTSMNFFSAKGNNEISIDLTLCHTMSHGVSITLMLSKSKI